MSILLLLVQALAGSAGAADNACLSQEFLTKATVLYDSQQSPKVSAEDILPYVAGLSSGAIMYSSAEKLAVSPALDKGKVRDLFEKWKANDRVKMETYNRAWALGNQFDVLHEQFKGLSSEEIKAQAIKDGEFARKWEEYQRIPKELQRANADFVRAVKEGRVVSQGLGATTAEMKQMMDLRERAVGLKSRLDKAYWEKSEHSVKENIQDDIDSNNRAQRAIQSQIKLRLAKASPSFAAAASMWRSGGGIAAVAPFALSVVPSLINYGNAKFCKQIQDQADAHLFLDVRLDHNGCRLSMTLQGEQRLMSLPFEKRKQVILATPGICEAWTARLAEREKLYMDVQPNIVIESCSRPDEFSYTAKIDGRSYLYRAQRKDDRGWIVTSPIGTYDGSATAPLAEFIFELDKNLEFKELRSNSNVIEVLNTRSRNPATLRGQYFANRLGKEKPHLSAVKIETAAGQIHATSLLHSASEQLVTLQVALSKVAEACQAISAVARDSDNGFTEKVSR